MKVFVTGATGFVGRVLVARLLRDGHDVIAYARNTAKAKSLLGTSVKVVGTNSQIEFEQALRESDAVVNLQGENLFSGRWSKKRKEALRDSRIGFTQELTSAMEGLGMHAPRILISGSAVGYYGENATNPTDETSAKGTGFLADLCEQWEHAAQRLTEHGTRVVCIRTGVVLGRDGGAMQKLLLPFQLGLGGRLASGKQHMAWIHVSDLAELIVTALADSRYEGVVNGTAPGVVTNDEFTRALGRALDKPTPFPVPGFAMQIALGEASSVLLGGQNVFSSRATLFGFKYQFADIDSALREIVNDGGVVISKNSDGDYVLRQELVVGKTLEEVFAFFSNAQNLSVLTPSDMSFGIRSEVPEQMEAGVVLEYDIKLGPIPMRWVSRIDSWEDKVKFSDDQLKGPYGKWYHTHEFEARGPNTAIIDTVAYRIPMGPFGKIAHWIFVKNKLTQIFAFRRFFAELRFGKAVSKDSLKKAS